MMSQNSGRLIAVVASIASIVGVAMAVLNWADMRSGTRAVMAQRVDDGCKRIDDHEARLRVVEEAIREQRPVMRALAKHFKIEITPEP